MGAEGIGLLRTEFLFSDRPTLPDEREQAEAYAAIITALGPARGPLIVRTLDAGADKPLPALAAYTRDLPPEANPALGVRGIRLHTLYPELLTSQMRAILRAAQAHPSVDLRIMLPMVATLDEIRAAHAVLVAQSDKLRDEGVSLQRLPPLGIMVETPAAVFGATKLAREAAFFSVGTNDLTQYVMAADRLNPRLADLSRPIQPAVLHAIAAVTDAAHQQRRHVGVCGEMAGEPRLAALLVGLGVDELSMAPASIPAVKESLAVHTSMELRELAQRVLQAGTLGDADRLLDDAFA
jgi:phosphoenolpyruvate-protein kinase (PTS system EI component)